jgi:hypothetical protein
MSEKRSRIDWDAIEPHYRAGIRSLKDIAAEFECSDAGILKQAKKMGWTRNLIGKIKARADAKVTAALVRAETGEAKPLTEAIAVEIEANVQSRIRIAHQTTLTNLRAQAEALLGELVLESKFKDKVFGLKALVEAVAKLVPLERQAYGVDKEFVDPNADDKIDPIEGARRLAFALARASNALEDQVVH